MMKTNKTKYTTETRYKGNTGHARHMMKTNKTKYTTETRPDTKATLGTTYDEDKQNKIHNRDQIQRQHWAR